MAGLLSTAVMSNRVLQIGNFPPPVCGWSMHTEVLHRELLRRGAKSRVLDIGPGRTIGGRECIPGDSTWAVVRTVVSHAARGYRMHAHVNGDSWKGFLLALFPVLVGRATGRPAALTFHAGPVQMRFPRTSGFWHHAFRLLFTSCGDVICNHEPVKKLIAQYGVPEDRIHAIPAFTTQYAEELPAPLPPETEAFLARHDPVVFTYTLNREEFTVPALLDAFREVADRHPKAGLLFVGPKVVTDDLRAAIEARGLTDRVLVPGNLPHAQFLTAMTRSVLYVRTHLRDGVCSSVLEALSLGIPVVAAADGLRPPSVVTYEPTRDAAMTRALADRVLEVLADPEAARARVIPPEQTNHLDDEIAVLVRPLHGAPALAPSAGAA
jgi:glycosyltransferase involved in cell wall biosynthesis